MKKPRAKLTLPQVVVHICPGPPSSPVAQVAGAAWEKLWDRLLAPCPAPDNRKPPAGTEGEGGSGDGTQPPDKG